MIKTSAKHAGIFLIIKMLFLKYEIVHFRSSGEDIFSEPSESKVRNLSVSNSQKFSLEFQNFLFVN